MTVKLTGPRRDPRGAATKQLVVFLHGYGADGEDLIALGDQWRGLLPNASFVSPHAPERCAGSPMGRQWFALSTTEPEDPRGAAERWNGVVSAQPSIDAFLDEELARLGLDESRLALVGFSQGAMMALHVGLRRKRAPAAIIGYSGLLVGPDRLGEAGAARARRTRADPAGPRRPGSGDPARSDVHRDERSRQGGNPEPVASLVRHRPRHRRGRTAPRRAVPRAGLRRPRAIVATRWALIRPLAPASLGECAAFVRSAARRG